MKHFGEEKLYHSKFLRELIFGKLRSFSLFCIGKDFQQKSEKVKNQTELSLQKVSKNLQNLQK